MAKKKKKLSGRAWKLFAYTILAAQAILSLGALLVILRSNLLPIKYLVAVMVVLLLLFFLSDILMILSARQKRKNRNVTYAKRGLGTTLSVFSIVVSLMVITMLSRLMTTIGNVSGDNTIVVTETTSVYVMKNDPARNLADAREYVFGYSESYDYENTQKAIAKLESDLEQSIQLQDFEAVVDMVDALYAGEVGAIILNESYVDILEDMDEYENFYDETRVLFNNTITIIEPITEPSKVEDITKDPFIMYLSGSDSRSGGLKAKTRSDVNILAVVNPETRTVLLINTPRDYYVDISVENGAKDKLTHCGLYGIDCSMKTLEGLYGNSIDYYLKMNFTGFETLVDAVGGITITSDISFTSRYGFKYVKGENHLNGEEALHFVRERKAFAAGDIARGKNQMKMIKALIDKMTSPAIITNYSAIMSSLEGMFATNASSDEISNLVKMQLAEGGSWTIQSFSMIGSNSRKTTYTTPKHKSYVMVPDEQYVTRAKELIDKVMSGQEITDDDLKVK